MTSFTHSVLLLSIYFFSLNVNILFYFIFLHRIGRAGCIPALIKLAHSEDNHAKCQAICTLRRLAMHADNRVATVEQGVLKALATAGRSTDIEIQRETAACGKYLSDAVPQNVVVIECNSLCSDFFFELIFFLMSFIYS